LASNLRITLGRRRCLAVMGSAAFTTGCHGGRDSSPRVLRVWAHHGQEAEHRALLDIARAFNDARARRLGRVELSVFPDFQYTEKLAIAAAAADMPDAFELDGPLVARFVDAELLAPIDELLDREEQADFLPSILEQGSIGGRLYALGAFESAAVLYLDRQLFREANVLEPNLERGFAWQGLMTTCARLKQHGVQPLALHMNESADEWYTYAFSPVIWSNGGRLIAADGVSVRGVLASSQNVASLSAWQSLFRQGYAQTDPVDPDPFGSGRVAMDWTGHWMLRSHLAKKGNRLGVMPLPRVGAQAASPCGSWCWAISARGGQQELAAEWLRWVTSATHGVIPMVRANGALPARRSAFAAFPEYQRPPHSMFRRQLEESAHPRPRTAFYATLTQRFAAALRDIAHGADVALRLARAEDEIARVIERRVGSGRRAVR
jgi:ABC-type glycerol-3-phosphate transport system substrate-binding protein